MQLQQEQPTQNVTVPTVSTKNKISFMIKKVAYIIVALVNTIVPTLISLGVLTLGSPVIIVSSAICSVCLLLASRSESLEALIKKYGLDSNKILLKLSDLQSFSDDIKSLRSEIQTRNIQIENNEPIYQPSNGSLNSARSEIITNKKKIKAYYDKENNTIEIIYNDTPRNW